MFRFLWNCDKALRNTCRAVSLSTYSELRDLGAVVSCNLRKEMQRHVCTSCYE